MVRKFTESINEIKEAIIRKIDEDLLCSLIIHNNFYEIGREDEHTFKIRHTNLTEEMFIMTVELNLDYALSDWIYVDEEQEMNSFIETYKDDLILNLF